jgi:hypothetical protein
MSAGRREGGGRRANCALMGRAVDRDPAVEALVPTALATPTKGRQRERPVSPLGAGSQLILLLGWPRASLASSRSSAC